MNSSQQNTPNKGAKLRYVRVSHPAHPLHGQIVKVLRPASDPPGAERNWIIEGPDGQHLKVLQSWVEPVSEGTSPVRGSRPEDGLWLDWVSLHNLATVVQYLQTKSQEVTTDETVKSESGSSGAEFVAPGAGGAWPEPVEGSLPGQVGR